MVAGLGVGDTEADRHLVIEAGVLMPLLGSPRGNGEHQLVLSRNQRNTGQERRIAASVGIGDETPEMLACRTVQPVQLDRHASGRSPVGTVEYMRGQLAFARVHPG
jgi:hypothetical protein